MLRRLRLDVGSVPPVATAMSTTAAMSATGTTSARMTTARVTSRPSARPSNRAVPWTRPWVSNSRPRPWASNQMAAAMMPAAPTGAAAPTKSATPGVTAPIEARPAPATIVPAISAAEMNKLGLLDIRWNGSLDRAVNGHRTGLADRAEQGERSRGGISRKSHEGLRLGQARLLLGCAQESGC